MASYNAQAATQLLAAAKEAKIAAGGTFRLTDFLVELEKIARLGIDSPDERKVITDDVMGFYDADINSHVPELFRVPTRQYVLDTFTAALNLAAGV